jgi:hypothetical protein
MKIKATCRNSYDLITKCDTVSGWSGDITAASKGSGEEELMENALLGASAAAVIALAILCIPPAQAHADDPCVSMTDPAAHQACIDESLPDNPIDRARMGDCQASPDYGANGQFCRNFWVRKSAPPNGGRTMRKGLNREWLLGIPSPSFVSGKRSPPTGGGVTWSSTPIGPRQNGGWRHW